MQLGNSVQFQAVADRDEGGLRGVHQSRIVLVEMQVSGDNSWDLYSSMPRRHTRKPRLCRARYASVERENCRRRLSWTKHEN